MLDPGTDLRAALVALLLTLAQRTVATGLAVDPAAHTMIGEPGFRFCRSISAVRPDIAGRVGPVEDIAENLAVMNRSVRHRIAPDQLVTPDQPHQRFSAISMNGATPGF